ncbi:hypothetical protein H8B15_06070 [Hymenobacter sp. BT507]|uniref:DUF3575 domain-containing protein n=1 Tax=Hymenobacter citatus TaxID=2763506 RepID=A0ABR7MHE3_9BACT|nr:hypothetical protein [Hymenobacter citatus]
MSYTEEVTNQPLVIDTVALRVQQEERAVWRLALNNLTFRRYGIHIMYERKLWSPAWSLLSEISPSYLRYPVGYYPNGYYRGTVNVRGQLAGRFYYNLERRIRRGHNAGNFSANYFSVSLGAGLGRHSDLPFQLDILHGQLLHTQVALLYGVQRRLWKRGFIDVNAGYVQQLTDTEIYNSKQITGSIRIGMVLNGGPATRSYVPEVTDGILRPQWYVGAQYGIYGYGAKQDKSPQLYNRVAMTGPYLYVGRYLQPRLAAQIGIQYDYSRFNDFFYPIRQGYYQSLYSQHKVALPMLVRYTLTKLPQRRTQVDVVVGAAIVASWQQYKRKEYINGQTEPLTIDNSRDRSTAINPILGLNAGYGFGRTQRVQATAEAVLINPVFSGLIDGVGVSLGLRYRFKYL